MQKIMGIDYGDARTGVALSDLLCSIVGSTTVVPSRNKEKAMADLVRIAQENNVGEIVVGLPKNMDGSEGPRAELCRAFAEELREATGLEVRVYQGDTPAYGGGVTPHGWASVKQNGTWYVYDVELHKHSGYSSRACYKAPAQSSDIHLNGEGFNLY